MFGLLVGFGISMFKKSIAEGKPVEFDLFTDWNENLESIIIIGVMLITLCFTCIYTVTNKLKFDNTLAIWLGIIYGSFIVVVTIIEVIRAYF